MGEPISSVGQGEYVGTGDGTLFICDPTIFTYSTAGDTVTGLTAGAAEAKALVFPAKNNTLTLTSVGNTAFSGKTTIEKALSVPESGISYLGNEAFKDCTSLESASFPAVETTSTAVFRGCTSLASAELPKLVNVRSNNFDGAGLVSISLPSATALGNYVFRGCASLVSISIPEVATVGQNAFNGCTALATVSLPAATSIDGSAFSGCTALTTVSMPSVETIGNYAFNGCAAATSFELGSQITAIGNGAFQNCSGVTSVVFGDGFAATLGTDCFKTWTFYGTDGATAVDKTDASALEGRTFVGTSTALVEQPAIRMEYDGYMEIENGMARDENLEVVEIGGRTYLHAIGIGSGTVTVDGDAMPYRVSKAQLDVFAFCGQSNASYYAYDIQEAPVPEPGTGYYYGMSSLPVWTWEESLAPEGYTREIWDPSSCSIWDLNADGSARIGDKFPGFAVQWHEQTGRRCLLVPCAIGGVNIGQFIEDHPMWRHTDSVITEALALLDPGLYDVHGCGFVWIQGESNATNVSVENYKLWWSAFDTAMGEGRIGGIEFPNCLMCKVQPQYPNPYQAQTELAGTVGLWQTDIAATFTQENGLMSSDGVHYSQLGDNAVATEFGSMMRQLSPIAA